MALSLALCFTALALGFLTTCIGARNRARAAELDARQRWCETYSRQNRLVEEEVVEREWRLLSGAAELPPAPDPEPSVPEVSW